MPSHYGKIPERTTEQLIQEVKEAMVGGKNIREIIKENKYLVYYFRIKPDFKEYLTGEISKFNRSPEGKKRFKDLKAKFAEPLVTAPKKVKRRAGYFPQELPHMSIARMEKEDEETKSKKKGVLAKLINKLVGTDAAASSKDDEETKKALKEIFKE